MTEYFIPIDYTDTHLAFDCEAERARREGFKRVAERQAATALHIRNAVDFLESEVRPSGHRLRMRIMFDFVPDVNPVMTDEARNLGR